MMALSAIKAESAKAARKAAHLNLQPLLVEKDDLCNIPEHISNIPNMGLYIPPGWEKVNEYFVDKAKTGRLGEPAMTFNEFCHVVKPGHGYALIEEGQFQVYVGEFRCIRNMH
jgi:hypothetical protein